MRIKKDSRHISIRDRPGPFWALGLFLAAGGALAIATPFGLANNAAQLETWERLACIGLGLGVGAGGLWFLWRSPGTNVQLDLSGRQLRLVRLGLSGRQERRLEFAELDGAGVEAGTDSEGGSVWRPAVRLRSGELLLLSELWSHDEGGVEETVAVVAAACRLPRFRHSPEFARSQP